MVDLGTNQITSETAKHLFLYGLKPHIRKEVFMHHPSNFQEMLLLAERADQAYMADKHGLLGARGQQGGGKGHQGQRKVDYKNVS